MPLVERRLALVTVDAGGVGEPVVRAPHHVGGQGGVVLRVREGVVGLELHAVAHPLVHRDGERVVGAPAARFDHVDVVEHGVRAGLGVHCGRVDGPSVGKGLAGGDQVPVHDLGQVAAQGAHVAEGHGEIGPELALHLDVADDRVLAREVRLHAGDALPGQGESGGQVGQGARERRGPRAAGVHGDGEAPRAPVALDPVLVEVEEGRVVHDPAGGPEHGAGFGVEAPREARAGGEVVLVDLERARERVVGEGPRGGDDEEVVAQPVQQLQAWADPKVVLHEEPVEGRVVGHVGVAQALGVGRVGAGVGPAPGGQVRVGGGERVELEEAVLPVVVDALDVEAGLERVAAVDQGEVVEHLPDPLLEHEAGVVRGRARDGAPEVRHPAHRDRGAAARAFGGRAGLVALRELEAQLVQAARPQRGDELEAGGMHPVRLVGGPLHGVEAAPDVEGGVVVEIEVAGAELVGGAQLVVGLPDQEGRVLSGGHDPGVGDGRGGQAEEVGVGPAHRDHAVRGEVAVDVLPPRVEVPLVPDDRPPQGARPVVHVGVGLPGGRGEEEGPGREVLPTEAEAGRARELVGPEGRDRVVDHARGLAELGGEAAGHHLHLADHDLRGGEQAQAGPVLLGVRVPVQHVVRAHLRPVGVDARHSELVVLEAGHVRLQEGEVVGVPGDEGQVLHLGFGDRAPEVDPARLGDGGLPGDGDHLGDPAHLERDVDDRGLAGGEGDPGALHGLEAGELRLDAIGAEGQQEGAVGPGAVRERAASDARLEVHHGHGDPGKDGARGVANHALDRAVGGLRLREEGRGHGQEGERDQARTSGCHLGLQDSRRGNGSICEYPRWRRRAQGRRSNARMEGTQHPRSIYEGEGELSAS